jgi:pyridoxamine-phosphate oxidase
VTHTRNVSSALDVNTTSEPQAQPTPTGVKLTAHKQYHAARLTPDSMPSDPLVLFRAWLDDALANVREPEAMTLCTATPAGVPSARAVLLKEVDARGFLFFTNYASRKGAELAANPHAALAMHWREIARQVRVVGAVERVSREESEAYFASRPRGSQVGAWASAQSSVVGEGELEAAVQQAEKRFEGKDVPCPPGWGGFRVVPT